MADLGEKLRPPLEALLEEGETLLGACVASQASLFKGRMVGIGVTEGRLLIQGLSRKFETDGPPILLSAQDIAAADAEGVSGGWPNLAAGLMDKAAVTLKLKTTRGEKLKLMMMRGSGPLGGLGGGETQREGVEALAAWFGRAGA